MKHVKVLTKTFRDNSGRSIELYSILIEHNGETSLLHPLHEYQLKKHIMSKSWHDKLVQAVELMLDYIDANQSYYLTPKDFFESFAEAYIQAQSMRMDMTQAVCIGCQKEPIQFLISSMH